jgi:hypothetical protein
MNMSFNKARRRESPGRVQRCPAGGDARRDGGNPTARYCDVGEAIRVPRQAYISDHDVHDPFLFQAGLPSSRAISPPTYKSARLRYCEALRFARSGASSDARMIGPHGYRNRAAVEQPSPHGHAHIATIGNRKMIAREESKNRCHHAQQPMRQRAELR